MTEIIGARFKSGGKQYYFDPGAAQVAEGQGVILETSRGLEYAECSLGNTMVEDSAVVQPLRPLVRMATARDMETVEENKKKAKTAFKACQEKIVSHGLDMKLVDVEYSFDGSKILFFFTSEGRVDFRALVKDLAAMFHSRIELRQIGVRDEAKMLGGLGICGKPLCCSTFLDDFQPVSIKMAKTQSLSLNPVKISGTCGRLMCCLKYEQEAYEDAVKRMPKGESFVETPEGAGSISQINLLRETVKVRLDSAPDAPRTFHHSEVNVVRMGKGKRPEGYVEPPLAELAKLRKVTPPPEDPAAKLQNGIGSTLSGMGMTAAAPAPQEPPRERRERGSAHPAEKPRQEKPKQEHPRQEKPKTEKPRADQPKQQRPKGDRPRPERAKPHQTKAPAPAAPAPSPQAEGTQKPRHKPRRHHRGGGKGKGTAPAPQSE